MFLLNIIELNNLIYGTKDVFKISAADCAVDWMNENITVITIFGKNVQFLMNTSIIEQELNTAEEKRRKMYG